MSRQPRNNAEQYCSAEYARSPEVMHRQKCGAIHMFKAKTSHALAQFQGDHAFPRAHPARGQHWIYANSFIRINRIRIMILPFSVFGGSSAETSSRRICRRGRSSEPGAWGRAQQSSVSTAMNHSADLKGPSGRALFWGPARAPAGSRGGRGAEVRAASGGRYRVHHSTPIKPLAPN